AGDEDDRTTSSAPEMTAQPAPGAAAAHAPGPGGASSLGGMGGAAGSAGAAAAFTMTADSPGAVLASLRGAPASQALDALSQAQSLSPGVLSKQRDGAQD